MKSLLTTIFLAFANSLPLSALPVTNYRDTPHQTVLSESLPNLPKCEDQLLQINTVNLSPNAQGQTLDIHATGTLLDKMERGASVALDLTTDTVSIWDKIVRLYLTVEDVWVRLNKGKMELKAVVVPKKNLVGNYYLKVIAYTKDPGQGTCWIGKDVTCNGEVPEDGSRLESERSEIQRHSGLA